MDINEKIKRLEESCERLAKDDAERLNEKIDKEIEEQIESDLGEYEKKQELSYKKQCEKIVKKYNKDLFDYEIECKKNVQNVKNIIKRELKEEAERRLIKFLSDSDYERFLAKCINSVLEKVDNDMESILYLTKSDMDKYAEELRKYNIKVKELDNYFIGGCKLENLQKGIIIDNTLKSNLDDICEKI